jgi:hypothetical protein
MASGSDAQTFFESLWSGLKGGHAAITGFHAENDRFKPDGPRFFAWPSNLDALLARSRALADAGAHAYFSIGLRQRASPEAAYIFAVPALWVTFNTAAVTVDQAVERLKAFPFKPSAGVLAARSLDVYWFLNEAMAGEEVKLVWNLNQKLKKAFFGLMNDAHYDPFLTALGGDYQAEHYDAAGLLRVPGSSDPSAGPAAPVEIVSWNFDVRHSLVDIYEHLTADEKPVPPPVDRAAPAAPAAEAATPAPSSPQSGRELPVELVQKTADHLAGIWIEGFRGKLITPVVGALAHADFNMSSVLRLIKAVCAITGDPQEAQYQVIAQETYRRKAAGETVVGWPTLEKNVADLPGDIGKKAKTIVQAIRKSMPKQDDDHEGNGQAKRSEDLDFDLVEIIRFESSPARYEVRLRLFEEKRQAAKLESRDLVMKGEEEDVYKFDRFRAKTFGQNHLFVAYVGQARWEELVEAAPFRRIEAPPEAKPAGAIESALEDFVENMKENPEVGDLKSFPGYDEKDVFFKLSAFKDFLKQNNLQFPDRQLCHQLKLQGWERDTKRFGPSTAKIWRLDIKTNGHPPPKQPETAGGGPSTSIGTAP